MIIPRHILSAITDAEAAALYELAKGCTVLELGAQYGFSTIMLAQTAKIVHSVDWHKGDGDLDSLPALRQNLKEHHLEDKVVIHVGKFEDIYPVLGDAIADMVFVDGAHDENSVYRDLEFAYECLRFDEPKGWIALHDIGRDHLPGFGVERALKRFVDEHAIDGVKKVDHLAILKIND